MAKAMIGSDPDEFNHRTVREVMTDAPDTVRPNDPIGIALRPCALVLTVHFLMVGTHRFGNDLG